MEITRLQYKSPEYLQQVQLRYEVLRAPLGLEFSEDFLKRDQYDLLFGYFENGQLLGCCQLTDLGQGIFQLRQMAVSPQMQGKSLGRALVTHIEQYLKDNNGGVKITLHARQVAQGFYEKIGYHIVGEPFLEVGIPHFTMEKILD